MKKTAKATILFLLFSILAAIGEYFRSIPILPGAWLHLYPIWFYCLLCFCFCLHFVEFRENLFEFSKIFLVSSLGAFLLISRHLLKSFTIYIRTMPHSEDYKLVYLFNGWDMYLSPPPVCTWYFREILWHPNQKHWFVISLYIVLLQFAFLFFLAYFLYALLKIPKPERKRMPLSKTERVFAMAFPFLILFVELIQQELIFPCYDKHGTVVLTHTERFLLQSGNSPILIFVTAPLFILMFRRILVNRWIVLSVTAYFVFFAFSIFMGWNFLTPFPSSFKSWYAIHLSLLLAMTFRAFFPAKPKPSADCAETT